MVFSELAREKDGQWGWMDKFKDTALCRLLSDSIRCDRQLQQCLHIVRCYGPADLATRTRGPYAERVLLPG